MIPVLVPLKDPDVDVEAVVDFGAGVDVDCADGDAVEDEDGDLARSSF